MSKFVDLKLNQVNELVSCFSDSIKCFIRYLLGRNRYLSIKL